MSACIGPVSLTKHELTMELDLQDECKPRGEALPTSNLLLKTIDKLTHDRVIPAEAAVNYPADQTFGQGPSVISQIEDIFESIADSILKREPHLLIKLKRRQKPSYNVHNTTVGVVQDLPDVGMKAIKFPSRKPHEAWKFGKLATFRVSSAYMRGSCGTSNLGTIS